MTCSFSLIIPVFNRPDEISELLQSLTTQRYDAPYEVVIVEDGSTLPSQEVAEAFGERLDISYYQKPNSGPGDSRNYGMERAKGNYFIILDSDCVLPEDYLCNVADSLTKEFVHCFGGPDGAHGNFSAVQKAINYAMTALLTTGGIRGGKRQLINFSQGVSIWHFQRGVQHGGRLREHPPW